MYASEEPSKLSKIIEISTWTLLFLALVPGTALGFAAENSLPNSPLYPVKRGIETVILTLVSINNSTKSAYQMNLATTRVNEVQSLFAENNTVAPEDISQLESVAQQLDATKNTINALPDATQKTQLSHQLSATVIQYQQQLIVLNQQLQTAQNTTQNTDNNPTVQPTHTLSQTQSTAQTGNGNTSTVSTSSPQSTENTPPPPPLNTSRLTQNQIQALEQTIQDQTQKLQELQQELQNSTIPIPSLTPASPNRQDSNHSGDTKQHTLENNRGDN